MRKNKGPLKAPSARVQLLREIVAEAERSVQFIADPCLKLAAFQKNLDTLLAERYPPPSGSKG